MLPAVFGLKESGFRCGFASTGQWFRRKSSKKQYIKVARIFGGDRPNIMSPFSTLDFPRK